MHRSLIVGNWKMNGLLADGQERARGLAQKYGQQQLFDMVLCPPFTIIKNIKDFVQPSGIKCGSQNCHAEKSGAYTGEISAEMLKDLGCDYVILGHSERRQQGKETSSDVLAKVTAAHRAGLIAIVCVGETDAERSAGRALEVVLAQVADSIPAGAHAANTVIAYEPVWAIGTGKVASVADIREMHAAIRKRQNDMRILYGGSVKPDNAKEILHIENVNGALVGGASLKVDEFWSIAVASQK